ncbi:MAG: hypothetical protein WDZ77_00350 [Candidatus Pacearchaeota archaeon]
MRKLISKEAEAKKKKKNQITVGVVLIFLMLFSTLGYAFQFIGDNDGTGILPDSETFNYNGFEFREQSGFFILSKDGKNFIFRNHPANVPNFNLELNSFESYLDRPLYINSESPGASSEIRTNLIQFVDGLKEGCFKDNCKEEFEKITCEDNFIQIRINENGENLMTKEGNCVFIEGKEEDLDLLADSFLFEIIGVS